MQRLKLSRFLSRRSTKRALRGPCGTFRALVRLLPLDTHPDLDVEHHKTQLRKLLQTSEVEPNFAFESYRLTTFSISIRHALASSINPLP